MKRGWEIKKLGEVAIFVNGDRGKNYPSQHDFVDDGVPFINAGHLVGGSIDFASMNYISEEKYNQLGAGKIVNGDILFCLRGSLGKRAIVKDVNYGAIASSLVIIRSKNVLLNRYLFHYLGSQTVQNLITKNDNGSSQPNLSAKSVSDFSIPIPSREEQERIVEELDCLSGVIEKKREQLRELDALAQSIFYQMFGDPITNEKGWEVKKLKNITSKIGSGATPKGGNESYKDEGISLIRSLNIHNNLFVYKDLAHIDDEQADALKNVVVEDGDVLLNITGASVARCCVVPNDVLPARVNQHVAIIRPKELENNIFICYQFTSNAFQQELLSIGKSNGATREALTKGQLEELDIIVPPLTLQEEFAEKIEKIEQQKKLISQSIKETEDLFNSRMSYYFN